MSAMFRDLIHVLVYKLLNHLAVLVAFSHLARGEKRAYERNEAVEEGVSGGSCQTS